MNCWQCGNYLEPEPDEVQKRTETSLFGIKDITPRLELYHCRVCEEKIIYEVTTK